MSSCAPPPRYIGSEIPSSYATPTPRMPCRGCGKPPGIEPMSFTDVLATMQTLLHTEVAVYGGYLHDDGSATITLAAVCTLRRAVSIWVGHRPPSLSAVVLECEGRDRDVVVDPTAFRCGFRAGEVLVLEFVDGVLEIRPAGPAFSGPSAPDSQL